MANLTCPKCGHKQAAEIPADQCVSFYACDGCGETIAANNESCCVFCDYSDEECPVAHVSP